MMTYFKPYAWVDLTTLPQPTVKICMSNDHGFKLTPDSVPLSEDTANWRLTVNFYVSAGTSLLLEKDIPLGSLSYGGITFNPAVHKRITIKIFDIPGSAGAQTLLGQVTVYPKTSNPTYFS